MRPWQLVLLVSVATRLAYFLTTRSVSFTHPIIDADYYESLGAALASGEGLGSDPFWQPPLYPLLIAFLYKLFGASLWWPRLVQSALSAVSSVLVVKVTERAVDDPRLATFAGLMHALAGPLVLYDGELLPTSLATSLVLIAFWLSARPIRSLASTMVAGACIGLSALAVAPTLLALPPIAMWLFLRDRRQGISAALVAMAIVSLATWSNYTRSGEHVFISANGGVNFWIGNNAHADATMAIRPGERWDELVATPRRHAIETASGQDKFFYERALLWCAAAPRACGANLFHKVRLTFTSREIPRNEHLDVVRVDAPVLSLLTPRLGSVQWPGVLLWPLCIVGAVATFQRRRPESRAALASVVFLLLPCVIYFPTARYRVPAIPLACVLSAVGVDSLLRGQKHRFQMVAAFVIGLVLAVAPTELIVDRVNFRAEMYAAAAARSARLGDHTESLALLSEAVALAPEAIESRFNLALTQEAAGQARAAIASYRTVLLRSPDDVGARLRLAGLLKQGSVSELREASLLYQALFTEFPEDEELQREVAECRARLTSASP